MYHKVSNWVLFFLSVSFVMMNVSSYSPVIMWRSSKMAESSSPNNVILPTVCGLFSLFLLQSGHLLPPALREWHLLHVIVVPTPGVSLLSPVHPSVESTPTSAFALLTKVPSDRLQQILNPPRFSMLQRLAPSHPHSFGLSNADTFSLVLWWGKLASLFGIRPLVVRTSWFYRWRNKEK